MVRLSRWLNIASRISIGKSDALEVLMRLTVDVQDMLCAEVAKNHCRGTLLEHLKSL